MKIRRRTAADLDACVAMLRAVHERDAYPMNWPADPRSWLLETAWIAEWDGAVAGHVAVQDGEIQRLFVSVDARRRSLGDQLVRHVLNQFRGELRLVVVEGDAAVRFYEATGWRHAGTQPSEWDPGVNVRRYELTPEAQEEYAQHVQNGQQNR
jgi:ribosomal protein S18 acetylase RimI-like enzyme